MPSDVKLNGETVLIEGSIEAAAGAELSLDTLGQGVRIGGPVKLPHMPLTVSDTAGSAEAASDFDMVKRMPKSILAAPAEPDITAMFIDLESPVELIHEILRLRKAIRSLDRRLKRVEKVR